MGTTSAVCVTSTTSAFSSDAPPTGMGASRSIVSAPWASSKRGPHGTQGVSVDTYFRRLSPDQVTARQTGPKSDGAARLKHWGFAERLSPEQAEFLSGIGPVSLSDALARLTGSAPQWTNRQTIADLLANVITISTNALGGKKRLVSQEVVSEALKLLLDLMPDAQCEALSAASFKRAAYSSRRKVIAVLGCQSKSLLESRVKRAHQLAQMLPGDVLFVLSGKHPPRKQVTILNESEYMASFLDRLIDRASDWKRRPRPDVREVVLESESADTRTNISNIFKLREVFGAGKQSTLLFVSSTFHLPRIADEYSSAAAAGHTGTPDVDNSFFVPAETNYTSGVVRQPEYVTATLLEMYRRVVADATGVSAALQGRRVHSPTADH